MIAAIATKRFKQHSDPNDRRCYIENQRAKVLKLPLLRCPQHDQQTANFFFVQILYQTTGLRFSEESSYGQKPTNEEGTDKRKFKSRGFLPLIGQHFYELASSAVKEEIIGQYNNNNNNKFFIYVMHDCKLRQLSPQIAQANRGSLKKRKLIIIIIVVTRNYNADEIKNNNF